MCLSSKIFLKLKKYVLGYVDFYHNQDENTGPLYSILPDELRLLDGVEKVIEFLRTIFVQSFDAINLNQSESIKVYLLRYKL